MAVTIPTKLPRWADNGGDIVEPTEGKKDVGWGSEEEPPAQYFNWLENLVYQWMLVLQAISAKQTRKVNRLGAATSGTWTQVVQFATCTASGTMFFMIPCAKGEVITALRFFIHESANAGTRSATAGTTEPKGTGASIGSAATNAAADNADHTLTVDLTSTPYTVGADEAIVGILSLISSDKLYAVEVDVMPSGLAP